MTARNFCEKLFKAILRIMVFLAVPLTTAFVMTGKAFAGINSVFLFVLAGLTAVLLAFCIFRCKNCVPLIITVCLLVFLALVRCVPEYVYSNKMSNYLISACGQEQHIFGGHIINGDAPASGGMYVDVESVDSHMLDIPVKAYCMNRSGHYYSEGEYIEITAEIRKPVSYSQDFDFASWLTARGVKCELYNISSINADYTKAKLNAAGLIREFVYSNALKMINYTSGKDSFDRGTALARALLWGDKSGFSDEELEHFSKSGMTHLLCVSGLHFTVVLGGLSLIVRLLIRKRWARKVALGIICVLYLCLCGFSKSAMRAAVMAFVSVPNGRNTSKCLVKLLASLSVICLIASDAILDTGFHLSVLSCGGIACSSHLSGIIKQKFDENPFALFVYEGASMALGSFAFTFAYCACAFGTVSTVSVITAVLSVWAAQACLVILWISVALGAMNINPLLFTCTGIYNRLSEHLYKTAEFFSKFKFASIPVNAPDIAFSVFILLTVLMAYSAFSKVKASKIYFYALLLSVVSVTILIQIS